MTGCITVKIRYSDFETTSKQETVDYTALDDVLIGKVKDLFNKSYQKTDRCVYSVSGSVI